MQVAVDGLEPTYSVLRSPLLPAANDEGPAGEGPVLLPCRLWGNSDRDGDVSGCRLPMGLQIAVGAAVAVGCWWGCC